MKKKFSRPNERKSVRYSVVHASILQVWILGERETRHHPWLCQTSQTLILAHANFARDSNGRKVIFITAPLLGPPLV